MKKRITALALACIMALGTVAIAAGTEKSITVSPMSLNVNGQAVTPTKSDGTPAEVFSYEGATYAPLRYLTELNGNQVVWNKNDPNTAKIVTTAGYTYADTVVWDGEYDVVVIGFGGAGAVASSTAADEGARVLLVEKAPEGHEGGNTRYCGQVFAYGGENEEGTYEYFQALTGQHKVPEAMLRTYTNGIAHIYDTMEKLTGIPKSGYRNLSGQGMSGAVSPEYPELPSSGTVSLTSLHEGSSDGFLWQTLRSLVTDRTDKIDVWFESPAVHLIQDPATKTILGVQVERGGKTLNIRANNGVVMTCGGFENNPEMVHDYLGLGQYNYLGTSYNTGDGIRMALEINADLWHMENYEADFGYGGTCIAAPAGERGGANATMAFASGAAIMVNGDGTRMLREDELARHGHIKQGDVWVNIRRPLKSYIICTAEKYDSVAAGIPKNAINIQKANTISELAKLIHIDPDKLSATVEQYNDFVSKGNDIIYGRAPETMAAIRGNGYYAIEVNADVLNTQGGARRNEKAEILDTAGNPIPHLYSAGEFGGICSFQYQAGGNIAECIIFGQIAGKNAAATKEALPAYQARTAVSSPLTHTPGKTSDLGVSAAEVTTGANEYLGVSHNGMGGDLQVKVTMKDGKIANVEIVKHSETPGISDGAREQVPAAIVKANSTEVDNVSGASITSRAIKEAVADALSQVK